MNPKLTLAIAALAAGLAAGAQAADTTMRLSHQFPPAHHSAKNLEQFAADVKANTGGKVEVQIFGAAQLFKPAQHHAAVAGGKIESAAVLSFQWGGTIPEMNVTVIPYFMSSVDKMRRFRSSEAQKMLDAKMAEKGVLNIAWLMDANDGIFTSAKKALVTPADFKGVKVRGLSKLFDAGLVAMGAVLAVTHLGLASSPWARLCVDTVVYGLSVGLILRGFFPVSLAAVLSRAPGSDRLSGWLRLPVMPVG